MKCTSAALHCCADLAAVPCCRSAQFGVVHEHDDVSLDLVIDRSVSVSAVCLPPRTHSDSVALPVCVPPDQDWRLLADAASFHLRHHSRARAGERAACAQRGRGVRG
jgi:hypothetical protein